MRTSTRIAASICVLATLAACSGSGSGQHFAPGIASISLAPDSPVLLVGETITLTATAYDVNGNVLADRTMLWSSSDTSVATVTNGGGVTALQAGRVEISATIAAVSGTTEIEVLDEAPSGAPVASVELTPTSAHIEEGNTRQFTATPRDATGRALAGRGTTWSMLDAERASVSPAGVVTALRSGATRVDVTVEGKSASAGVTISSAHTHGLLYSQAVAVASSQLFMLDINDPAGSEIPVVLAGTAHTDPSASPDGSRIAWVQLTPPESAIYTAPRTGGTGVRLTTGAGTWDQPAWSPDGALIAFRGRLPGQGSDIWVIAPDGTGAVNLTASHGATSESSPAWSPHAVAGIYRIAYSHSENGLGHLWTMRADGTDKRQVTSSASAFDDMPSYSPDGSQLVFVRSGPGLFGDLYVVAATGGAGRLLMPLSGPLAGPQLEPTWSPDGRLVAFASRHADEHYQIYTVWGDGTRLARRTSDPFDHSSPTWIALQ